MAKDVALRELDQAGFRISRLGDPQAAGDATKTDNQAIPRANAGTGAAGSSLLAAPVDHVHPASVEGGGNGGLISVDDPSYQTVTGQTEEVVSEAFVDLRGISAALLKVSLAAIVKVSAGAATFNVRVGGVAGQPDGTVIATVVTNSNAFVGAENLTTDVANPGGQQLLKICGHADAGAGVAHIYGKTIQLQPQIGA